MASQVAYKPAAAIGAEDLSVHAAIVLQHAGALRAGPNGGSLSNPPTSSSTLQRTRLRPLGPQLGAMLAGLGTSAAVVILGLGLAFGLVRCPPVFLYTVRSQTR